VDRAASFRQRAEQCRRLARGIPNRNDPTVASLEALAKELDGKAGAAEGEEATNAEKKWSADKYPR
jgi:hypothetical protein